MNTRRNRSIVFWVGAPVLVFALGMALGVALRAQPDEWTERLAALSPERRAALEAAPAVAVANATWAFGTVDAVKEGMSAELARIPETDGPSRARALLRFGIVDTNPDGQAAVFSAACAADPKLCDNLRQAAEREVRERLVAPGNVVPLSLGGDHPPLPGH